MARLNTFVHVVAGERSGVFGPGDQVPGWAVAAISNPDVWDEAPEAVETVAEDGPVQITEPPRGGPGSSADAWRQFAKVQSLDFPEGASARDIQALWDARN